ncbi:MAG TPA: hypothetical protein VFA75_19545 [Nevskia sp.]|nr:hypothetical protein [Nevskia sp.]
MNKLIVPMLVAVALAGSLVACTPPGEIKATGLPPTASWQVTDQVNHHSIVLTTSNPTIEVSAGDDVEVVAVYNSRSTNGPGSYSGTAGVKRIDYSIPQATWHCSGKGGHQFPTVYNLFSDKVETVQQPNGTVLREVRYWYTVSWESKPPEARTAWTFCGEGSYVLEGDTQFQSTGTTFEGLTASSTLIVHTCRASDEPTCKPL